MGDLIKVYVDSSHRAKDCKCQAGISFHDPLKNKPVSLSSEVFEAENNNDAEILGIYYAIAIIYSKFNITKFRVFNDSVIACEMLGADDVSLKILKKHPVLQFVRDFLEINAIELETEQVCRNHKMMKVCDKYSKKFRKEKS